MPREGAEGENPTAREHKRKGRKKRRAPSFCPNSSKSFSLSTTDNSGRWSKVSKTSLKKNNAELAKALNKCKLVIARLKDELQEQGQELLYLQQEYRVKCEGVENEVQKRLKEVLYPVRESLNSALDNMTGLSDNLMSSMRLVSAPLRMSQISTISRNSTSRNSSIGTLASNLRMRNAACFALQNPSSPTKQLPQSKVAPMVAGHAISRPRIHLTRMDLTEHHQPVQQAEELGAEVEDEEANHQAEEEEEVAEEEAVEVDDEAAPPALQVQQPEPSRRNRFNLTIIGEEENNDLDEMSPSSTISPDRSDVDVEVEDSEMQDPDFREPPRVLVGAAGRRFVFRSRIGAVSNSPPEASSTSSEQVALIRAPEVVLINILSPNQRLSSQGSSPTVDSSAATRSASVERFTPVISALATTTAAVAAKPTTAATTRTAVTSTEAAPSNHVGAANRSTPADSVRPCSSSSTPDAAAVASTPAKVVGGGRGSASSCQSNTSSSGRSHALGTTPRVPSLSHQVESNSSETGEKGAAGPPVNGGAVQIPEDPSDSFFMNMDYDPLEGPSWLCDSSDRRKRKKKSSAARKLSDLMTESKGSRSSRRLANSLESSDLLTDTHSTNSSDGETSGYVLADDLQTRSMEIDSSLEAAASAEQVEVVHIEVVSPGKRTPLREMTMAPSGRRVTYNPRLDTGLVVEKLKEARILIQNSPDLSELSATSYRLSDVYITSPGRTHTLEEVVTVGLTTLSLPPTLQRPKDCYVKVAKSPAVLPNSATEATAPELRAVSGGNEGMGDDEFAGTLVPSSSLDEAAPPRRGGKSVKSKSEVPGLRPAVEEGEEEEEEKETEKKTKTGQLVKRKGGQSEPGVGLVGASKKKRFEGEPPSGPASPAESDKENKESEGDLEGNRRGRRAAAQISFKEPSLRGKMRQGDPGSTSVYTNFVPLKGKKPKK